MSFTPITLTGGPYKDAHGNPLNGYVILRLTQLMTQPGGGAILPTETLVPLDGSGSFSKVVTATNDPATQQTGVAYQVVFETNLGFSPSATIYIEVPYNAAGGTIDINSCPWTPSAGYSFGGGGPSGGNTGIMGPQGPQGPQGGVGPQGAAGSNGSAGAQGAQGPQGATGGGGGGGPTEIVVPFAYNTAGILTGATLWTPTIAQVIYDWWVEIDTAWNGLTPHFDLGTLTSGVNGLLSAAGLSPIPLWTPDAALGGNAGISAPGFMALGSEFVPVPSSWSAALANAGLANGPPIGRQQLLVTAANPLKGIVSQDGTAQSLVAYVASSSNPTVPFTVSASFNDTFIFVGDTPTGGGGTATPETFTVAPGTYANATTLAAAIAAATGSVSGEALSTKCSVVNFTGAIIFEQTGGGHNGNMVQPGPTDILADLNFTQPAALENGGGGSPGATQGSAKLHLLVAS